MLDLATINNVLAISKSIFGKRELELTQESLNGISGCNRANPLPLKGCCNHMAIYLYIENLLFRQSDLWQTANYQLLIYKLFSCMSLQPEYYTYTGGVPVNNATVSVPNTNNTSYADFTIQERPPAGTTVLPYLANDVLAMEGSAIISLKREGIGMQSIDNTRQDYFGYSPTPPIITLSNAANGSEIFEITYKKLVTT